MEVPEFMGGYYCAAYGSGGIEAMTVR